MVTWCALRKYQRTSSKEAAEFFPSRTSAVFRLGRRRSRTEFQFFAPFAAFCIAAVVVVVIIIIIIIVTVFVVVCVTEATVVVRVIVAKVVLVCHTVIDIPTPLSHRRPYRYQTVI